jgi:phosphopantetheinyl transferase (holo-ACP synthase)
MIGNDIVDLALAKKDSNWKRRGFLDKLFTQKEQELILSSSNPEIILWNLWSRKEAGYKIYNRLTGIRAFIPLQFSCNYLDKSDGTVNCQDSVYFTKTTLIGEQINTIAVLEKDFFTKIKVLNSQDRIKKVGGIPFYYNPITQEQFPASISHHGRYSSCIILEDYLMPNLDFNFKNNKEMR